MEAPKSPFTGGAEEDETMKLHIELILHKNCSNATNATIIANTEAFLKQPFPHGLRLVYDEDALPNSLSDKVIQIKLCDEEPSLNWQGDFWKMKRIYHLYRLEDVGSGVEEISGENGESIPAATIWTLPCTQFLTLWDCLIYDSQVKEQLLNFASTTLTFSDRRVDSNIIAWNRVVLLHGPPGTGKTSLCKALAQKLSIRLNHRFQYGHLIEVNSHSLFSRWFSESGKLLLNLFSKISELVEDPQALVCVLIDEVESLCRSRESMTNGSDPSDALRVVNALLTQLDHIKSYPNVLILTTSNISGILDLAFVDRADIKQYVGLPSPSAIYQIYFSCIKELMKTGIICGGEDIMTLSELKHANNNDDRVNNSRVLWSIAEKSEGLSGRSLRKIPFLAHALHVHTTETTLKIFLGAMHQALLKHTEDQTQLMGPKQTSKKVD